MSNIDKLTVLEKLYYSGVIDRNIFINYYFYKDDNKFIIKLLEEKNIINLKYKENIEYSGKIVFNRINMTNMKADKYSFYKLERFIVIDIIENNLLLGLSLESNIDNIKDFFKDFHYSTIKYIYLDENIIDEKLEELLLRPNDLVKVVDSIKDIPNFIDILITEAIGLNVSDIHIEPFENIVNIRFRINGELNIYKRISKLYLREIITRMKVISKLDIAERRDIQDGEFSFKFEEDSYDIRISVVPTIHGEKIALRILGTNRDNLDINNLELGIHLGNFRKLIDRKSGLVIVTGPTGCGKTTTLYCILKYLRDINNNIMTIEDPVEYKIDGINQIQVNNKIEFGFEKGLKAILRNDSQIIMIGEIRNKETAINATRASITGHLVLSTLHTNSSFDVIDRLIDIGVEPYMVASSLKGVISQRLVKILCPRCKEEYISKTYENIALDISDSIKLYKNKGCDNCYNGYIGRRAIYEVLTIDNDLSKSIRHGESIESIKNNFTENYHNIKDECINLIKSGKITFNEIYNIGDDNYV